MNNALFHGINSCCWNLAHKFHKSCSYIFHVVKTPLCTSVSSAKLCHCFVSWHLCQQFVTVFLVLVCLNMLHVNFILLSVAPSHYSNHETFHGRWCQVWELLSSGKPRRDSRLKHLPPEILIRPPGLVSPSPFENCWSFPEAINSLPLWESLNFEWTQRIYTFSSCQVNKLLEHGGNMLHSPKTFSNPCLVGLALWYLYSSPVAMRDLCFSIPCLWSPAIRGLSGAKGLDRPQERVKFHLAYLAILTKASNHGSKPHVYSSINSSLRPKSLIWAFHSNVWLTGRGQAKAWLWGHSLAPKTALVAILSESKFLKWTGNQALWFPGGKPLIMSHHMTDR